MFGIVPRGLALTFSLLAVPSAYATGGIKVEPTAWWSLSFDNQLAEEMTPSEEAAASTASVSPGTPPVATLLAQAKPRLGQETLAADSSAGNSSWRISNIFRSFGFDRYTGSVHEGGAKGKNEKNDGQALLLVFNVNKLCAWPVWPESCVKLVHDSFRTELYAKVLGRIDNSWNGTANHYGFGLTLLYTPQVSQRWRLIAGGGLERLRLKYCVPRYQACIEGFATIPYYLVGVEYVSKGLRIGYIPKMDYLIPRGTDPDAARVTLGAHRFTAEWAFWGV